MNSKISTYVGSLLENLYPHQQKFCKEVLMYLLSACWFVCVDVDSVQQKVVNFFVKMVMYKKELN